MASAVPWCTPRASPTRAACSPASSRSQLWATRWSRPWPWCAGACSFGTKRHWRRARCDVAWRMATSQSQIPIRHSPFATRLPDPRRSLLDDRQIDMLGEVDFDLHETEVGRHVEILLQRLEVGQHAWVAIVVL